MIEQIKQIKKQLGELLKLSESYVFFDVVGNIVYDGVDVYRIQPEHLNDYLEIKLKKYKLMLDQYHTELLDFEEFASIFSTLTTKACEYYE